MTKPKDLVGQRFGRLVVIEPAESKRYKKVVHSRFKCQCDCGSEKIVFSQALIKGHTKSCGCLHSEMSKKTADNWTKDFAREGTKLNLIIPNEKVSKNNTSGVTGVYWDKTFQKWNANIVFKRRKKNLGYFLNKQDAINARKEAEDKYFKPILEKYNHEVIE